MISATCAASCSARPCSRLRSASHSLQFPSQKASRSPGMPGMYVWPYSIPCFAKSVCNRTACRCGRHHATVEYSIETFLICSSRRSRRPISSLRLRICQAHPRVASGSCSLSRWLPQFSTDSRSFSTEPYSRIISSSRCAPVFITARRRLFWQRRNRRKRDVARPCFSVRLYLLRRNLKPLFQFRKSLGRQVLPAFLIDTDFAFREFQPVGYLLLS